MTTAATAATATVEKNLKFKNFFQTNLNGSSVLNQLLSTTKSTSAQLDTRSSILIDQEALNSLTPYISGNGVLIVVKMPDMLSTKFSAATTFFKTMLMVFATGLDGISDKTIETGQLNLGTDANTLSVPTTQTGFTKEVTITFPTDFNEQPLQKYIELWMSAMVGATNTAHYFDDVDGVADTTNVDFGLGNQTMTFIYATLDPSKTRIQSARLFSNSFPITDKDSMNNFKKGEHNVEELQFTFSVHERVNHPDIFTLAQTYLNVVKLRARSIDSLRHLVIDDTTATTAATTPTADATE